MTKPEILDYLELPDEATDNDIVQHLENKLSYFTKLKNSVANSVLLNRYQQNIDKIKQIQAAYGFSEPRFSPAFSASEDNYQNDHVADPPVAWLIKHTENKRILTYPLYTGINYIGRAVIPNSQNILIDDDAFVSRTHAAIYVEGSDPHVFSIRDSASANNGKRSKNGTYINGEPRLAR